MNEAAEMRRQQRTELIAKLEGEGDDERVKKLRRCAEVFEIECLCCGKRKEVERGCKRRWCPVCGPAVARDRYWRKHGVAHLMQWPLSVVLTERSKRSITGAITEFKESLRSFRRTKFWRASVSGGLQSLEVTHSDKGWHVHAHLLLDCRWLAITATPPQRGDTEDEVKRKCQAAQRELSVVWASHLGQRQSIVWVNRAYGKALDETLKYAVKATDLLEVRKGLKLLLDEIDAGRMLSTFGNCHAGSEAYLGKGEDAKPVSRCDGCAARSAWVPRDLLDIWHRRPDLMPAAVERNMHAQDARHEESRRYYLRK